MATSKETPLVGLIHLNECCIFAWEQQSTQAPKRIETKPWHCDACIAAARRLGYQISDKRDVDAGDESAS